MLNCLRMEFWILQKVIVNDNGVLQIDHHQTSKLQEYHRVTWTAFYLPLKIFELNVFFHFNVFTSCSNKAHGRAFLACTTIQCLKNY